MVYYIIYLIQYLKYLHVFITIQFPFFLDSAPIDHLRPSLLDLPLGTLRPSLEDALLGALGAQPDGR